jgi:hypothetical protein
MVKASNNTPMFRPPLLARLRPSEVGTRVENYRQCGYKVLGFIMNGWQPVCGLNRIYPPQKTEQLWGGMSWYSATDAGLLTRGWQLHARSCVRAGIAGLGDILLWASRARRGRQHERFSLAQGPRPA